MRLLLLVAWLGLAAAAAYGENFQIGTIRGGADSRLHLKPSASSPGSIRLPAGDRVLLMGKMNDFYDVLEMRPRAGVVDHSGYLHESRLEVGRSVLGAASVRDADGWSNLRQTPSSSARIVRRVSQSEYLYVLHGGPWTQVMTSRGETGFVHSSRLAWIVPRRHAAAPQENGRSGLKSLASP